MSKKAKAAGKSFFSKETWKKAVKCDQSDWGETVAKTLVDVTAGFAGAASGSFLGWAALPVGVAGNVWANKTGHSWARAISIGMMTAPIDDVIGASRRAAGTGFDIKAEVSEGTERFKKYGTQVYQKFGLHKVFGKSSATQETSETVNGLGNATFDELDKHEQQIVSSGIEYEGGVPSARHAASAASQQDALEAFSVNGLDDLNTRHII